MDFNRVVEAADPAAALIWGEGVGVVRGRGAGGRGCGVMTLCVDWGGCYLAGSLETMHGF